MKVQLLFVILSLFAFSSYALCPKNCTSSVDPPQGICQANNTCSCVEGWGGVGCDEVSGDPNCPLDRASLCSPDARCRNINTPASPVWVCNCYDGFRDTNGDGAVCTDIDECVESQPCDSNAQCTNLPGTFTCKCNTGYQGDGVTCVDIDECATIKPCRSGTSCRNLPPPVRFTCECLTNFPFRVDDFTCTNDSRAPVAPVTPVNDTPTVPDKAYQPIYKVVPTGLCFTVGPQGTNIYYQVKSKHFATRTITGTTENSVKFNDGAPNTNYPGLITNYPIGTYAALVVNIPKSDTTTTKVTYRLDGFDATVDKNDASLRCPKDVILSFGVELDCSVGTTAIQDNIRSRVETLLRPKLTSQTVTVTVSGCSKKRVAGSATVTITDDTVSDTQASAMDIVFPTLLDKSLANAVASAGGVTAPPGGAAASVSSSNLKPVEGAPDRSIQSPDPEITLGGLNVSILTFAIILGSVIIGLIIICIMGVVIWRAKKAASEERV